MPPQGNHAPATRGPACRQRPPPSVSVARPAGEQGSPTPATAKCSRPHSVGQQSEARGAGRRSPWAGPCQPLVLSGGSLILSHDGNACVLSYFAILRYGCHFYFLYLLL